jgi:hypothetical protein
LLNADGTLWQEKLGCEMERIGQMSATPAEAVLRTISACLNTVITCEHPMLEGELPLDGSRFAGQLPPVVSAPTLGDANMAVAFLPIVGFMTGLLRPMLLIMCVAWGIIMLFNLITLPVFRPVVGAPLLSDGIPAGKPPCPGSGRPVTLSAEDQKATEEPAEQARGGFRLILPYLLARY